MRRLLLAGFSAWMLCGLVDRESAVASDDRSAETLVSISSTTVTMNNRDPYYQPFVAEVSPKGPVRWINPTPSPHTVRHDGCKTDGPCLFDSGAVAPDEQFVLPGLPPGRYPYHCELHPVMRGILVVKEPRQSAQAMGEFPGESR